jgi:predicted DsbA family dithiol-disulfide isomerase
MKLRNIFVLWLGFLVGSSLLEAGVKTILVTGNTASYLEPCGCVEGMLGGISRRPQAIVDEKDFLLLDSGNFIDIKHKLDETRNLHYAQSFLKLGYDAVGLSSKEAQKATTFLKNLPGKELFVATNLMSSQDGSFPFQRHKEINGFQVLSLVSPSIQVHSDFKVVPPLEALKPYRKTKNLILLSGLKPDELDPIIKSLKSKLRLVIANQSHGEFEWIRGVPVIYPGEKGKMVKKFDLAAKKYTSLAVLDSYEENKEIKSIVDSFYKAVEEDPELQKGFSKLFESDPMEQLVSEGKNRFVGSENCKSCHKAEYDQHKSTSHSHAFDVLLQKKRDFVPACVKCHSIGFGYESGYKISTRLKQLQNVGCESCHGAGYNHVRNPSKKNISLEVPKSRCMQCHDSENSPYFQYAAFKPMVDHSTPAPSNAPSVPIQKSSTVVMDLYVMSECPFGLKAENKLLPLVQKYSDRVQLNLRFIATDVEGKVKEMQGKQAKKEKVISKESESSEPGCKADFELDPDAKFQSLHGKSEVDEDIRQVVISKLFPDSFFAYVLERNKNVYGDWRAPALKLGLKIDQVEAAIKDGRGDTWFRENIAHGNDKGISASPTLRVNGSPYALPFDTSPLEFQICDAMEGASENCINVAACSNDAHCVKEGKNGFCKSPGTRDAVCEFKEPVAVQLTMIVDEDCGLCESGRFLQNLFQLYPKLEVETISSESAKAKKILEQIKVSRFPLFVFQGSDFKKSPRTKRLERYLAVSGGVYFINPLVNEVASLDSAPNLKSLKIYTNPYAQTIGVQKDALEIIRKAEETLKMAVDFQVVPLVSQVQTNLEDPKVRDQAFMVMYNDGAGRSMPIYLQSRNGKKEILEALTQLCTARHAESTKTRAYLKHVSTVVSESLAKARSQEDLSKAIQALDGDGLRSAGFQAAGIEQGLQKKISECVGGPEGARELLMSLIDLAQKQVVAAPTLLINDYYVVRGASKRLMDSLPKLLETNQPPDETIYGLP